MCGDYFLKERLTKEFERASNAIEGYHVHIYFDPETASAFEANNLAFMMHTLFFKDVLRWTQNSAIGPHTKPNLELDITKESFARIVTFLQENQGNLSILIHPQTGDDLKDHLKSSLWIGEPVPYSKPFFDRLQARRDGPKN